MAIGKRLFFPPWQGAHRRSSVYTFWFSCVGSQSIVAFTSLLSKQGDPSAKLQKVLPFAIIILSPLLYLVIIMSTFLPGSPVKMSCLAPAQQKLLLYREKL